VATVAQRLARLEAESDILRAIFAYCQHMDSHSHKQWVALFASDGVLDVRYRSRNKALNHREKGHRALDRWVTGYNRRRPAPQRHLLAAPLVQVRGTSATAVSYFATLDEYEDGPKIVASGLYRDRFILEKGRWLIKERIVDVAL
jgi:hypothetical protein